MALKGINKIWNKNVIKQLVKGALNDTGIKYITEGQAGKNKINNFKSVGDRNDLILEFSLAERSKAGHCS